MAMDPVALDAADELARFREEFNIPLLGLVGAEVTDEAQAKEASIYLCGNSLGPLAKRSQILVQQELDVWATRGVEGHFNHPHQRPWVPIADLTHPHLAALVGASEDEVACMGTLTANLHLMITSFYKPTKERFKIICEAKAFPSDQYAFRSQIVHHGLDPSVALIEVAPRQGEFTLRDEDILAAIDEHGSQTALVLFSGVQYYSGQWFPMGAITRKAKEHSCVVGFDLAHAIGNVPMKLHDWGVDFAVWCTYKYLNAGPGSIAGLFVHSDWNSTSPPVLHGWWGHDPATRFAMPPTFSSIMGAQGYQQSNPSALLVAALLGSLEQFHAAGGIDVLRAKSLKLTAYLESLLRSSKHFVEIEDGATNPAPTSFTIITPKEPERRGAQLSLFFYGGGEVMLHVAEGLKKRGVVGDERKPDVIRLAPAPLFNTFVDCKTAIQVLEEALNSVPQSS